MNPLTEVAQQLGDLPAVVVEAFDGEMQMTSSSDWVYPWDILEGRARSAMLRTDTWYDFFSSVVMSNAKLSMSDTYDVRRGAVLNMVAYSTLTTWVQGGMHLLRVQADAGAELLELIREREESEDALVRWVDLPPPGHKLHRQPLLFEWEIPNIGVVYVYVMVHGELFAERVAYMIWHRVRVPDLGLRWVSACYQGDIIKIGDQLAELFKNAKDLWTALHHLESVTNPISPCISRQRPPVPHQSGREKSIQHLVLASIALVAAMASEVQVTHQIQRFPNRPHKRERGRAGQIRYVNLDWTALFTWREKREGPRNPRGPNQHPSRPKRLHKVELHTAIRWVRRVGETEVVLKTRTNAAGHEVYAVRRAVKPHMRGSGLRAEQVRLKALD